MYKNLLKRVLDICLALLLMPLIIPVIAIFGLLIKLEDRGSIFYLGERLGKNKKIFKMYKLRSMKINAPDIRNEDGSTFNSDNDPRLLKIGKFIRKTSIDELPQIINVFLGEMSFIGPRPDLAEQLSLYKKYNKDTTKFKVKPGITGYAQCNGRNNLSWGKKLEMDKYYVENYNFILDFNIIIKTAVEVLLSKGVNKVKLEEKKK